MNHEGEVDNMALKTALVVGGGIAGLSAAISLGKRGVAVTVLELYDKVEGASIGISNRAVEALQELGVLDQCIENGLPIYHSLFSSMRDSAGNLLHPPGPDASEEQTTGTPGLVCIYRPDLIRILSDTALNLGVKIHHRETVKNLIDHGPSVEAVFSDDSKHHYDLVIGADGDNSQVRSLIHGDVVPCYTGHMSLRWMLPDAPPGQPGFYTQTDGRMVATTRFPNDLAYVASGVDMPERRVPQDEARQLLRDILDEYTAPFLVALRKRLDDHQTIIVRPFSWLLVPKPWHRGRITLLGDAAHSTTAHLSSGGGMALEDGVVLGQELARTKDISHALDNFMERRFERTRFVVDTSVELSRLQQIPGGLAQGAGLRFKAIGTLMQPY